MNGTSTVVGYALNSGGDCTPLLWFRQGVQMGRRSSRMRLAFLDSSHNVTDIFNYQVPPRHRHSPPGISDHPEPNL